MAPGWSGGAVPQDVWETLRRSMAEAERLCKERLGAMGWSEQADLEADGQETEWGQRMGSQGQKSIDFRSVYALYMVRQQVVPDRGHTCASEGSERDAVLTCLDRNCGSSLRCSDCDRDAYPYAHMHERQVWNRGFYEAIHPCEEVDARGVRVRRPKCFPCAPLSCTQCGGSSWSAPQTRNDKLLFVSLQGAAHFARAEFGCQTCASAGIVHTQAQMAEDYLVLDMWPAYVGAVKTVYDQEVFRVWERICLAMPGSASTNFCQKVLQEVGKRRGVNGSVDPNSFRRAYSEWAKSQHELRFPQRYRTPFSCPACLTTPLAIIVDGNRKLLRWKRLHTNSLGVYYDEATGRFLAPDAQVAAHLKVVYGQERGLSAPDNFCGSRSWKAARNQKASAPNQDIYGVVTAGCRHDFLLSSVNMLGTGELYAYSNYLLDTFRVTRHAKFFIQDIPCKYWPWQLKMDSRAEASNRQQRTVCGALNSRTENSTCGIARFYGA